MFQKVKPYFCLSSSLHIIQENGLNNDERWHNNHCKINSMKGQYTGVNKAPVWMGRVSVEIQSSLF